jgi:transitional endoplasmic reticulum ATPase
MSPTTEAVEKRQTEYERQTQALLDALAKVGGQRVEEDALIFEGKKLILPETMSAEEAIDFLHAWLHAQNQPQAFNRKYNYRPWDGAHAVNSSMKKVFGTAGIQRAVWSFFGMEPPQQITIQTGHGKSVSVPWGNIEIPIFDGTMTLGARNHKEYGPLFTLQINAPKRFAPHVHGLFEMVEEELRTNSIYRHKAFDGQTEPEFLDLLAVDPERVIYSDGVMAQLEANIWSLIEYTDAQREMNLPLKRATLLYGPYGTGKTLAGMRTAQIASENGWTYIYCRPARDDLLQVIQTARLYQPCIVFVEDIDTISSSDDPITRLLDIMDGIQAKGTEIMVVMTTNHPETIHKAMLRPGRLDSIVEIAALDEGGVRRMIESVVAKDMRGKLNYATIYKAMEGYLPAFVKESIDRAIRYAVVREGGKRPKMLATEDFVLAAEGLRLQWEMMHGAKEGQKRPMLETALQSVVTEVVHGTQVMDTDRDPVFELAVPEGNHS